MVTDNIEFSRWDENGRQVIWDATSLGDSLTCWYLYKIKRQENWRPTKDIENLEPEIRNRIIIGNLRKEWGKAYHDCQRKMFSLISNGMPVQEALHEAIRHSYQWRSRLEKPSDFEGRWDNSRTLDTLIRSLIWYVDQYNEAFLETILLPNGEAAVEMRFEVPLPYSDKRISGIIDRLVRWDGAEWVLDYKSTSATLSPSYFAGFNPDVQIYTYLRVARKELGIPVRGFIVDAAQSLVGGTRFQRGTIEVGDEELDRFFREQVAGNLGEYVRNSESGVWPQRFTSCGLYGGCELRRLGVCTAPQGQHADILRAQGYERQSRSRHTAGHIQDDAPQAPLGSCVS